MIGALLYLRLTSLQNLIQSRLRRLKQPKYLVGAIVGVAYFYLMFIRRMGSGRSSARYAAANHMPTLLPADALPTVTLVGAVILMVLVALAWIVPDQRAGLNFSEAEIAFLFPAPARRRTLIWYKLLNSQFAILFSAALITLFTGSWSFLGGNALTHALGWWFILATLNLHIMGSSFVMTRLMDKGITPWRRRIVVLGLVALVALVILVWMGRDLRAPQSADLVNFRTTAAYLETLYAGGPLPWLLLPARLVIGPFLAPDTSAFFLAVGPALLVFGLHLAWVLRSEVSFEDASIAKSEKRAARVAAVREGRWRATTGAGNAQSAPFRLLSTGRPEIAFLWKNLISTFSIFRARSFVIAALVIVAGCQWLERDPHNRGLLAAVGGVALVVAAYLLFLGPQLARQDLRSDLLNTDILKTYPLRGWQVVLGEMLTPVAILTGLLWLVLLTLLLAFHPHRLEWLTPSLRLLVGIGLVPVVPVLCALQLLVPNAAALVFPAWAQAMRNRSERGIEMMGQRLIFVGGQLLVVLFALLPAVLAVVALVFINARLIGAPTAVAVGFAIAAVLVILVAEVGCGLWLLGQRFEKLDLSSELRP